MIVTPYRGAGRPQGVFAMERTMDAIAQELGLDRTEVRAANFIQPDEFPYDHGLTFQDGRPLIYDSGDYPELLRKAKALVGWDEFAAYRDEARAQGRRVGIGLACYVEGTGVGPYEGAHVQVETSGRVNVAIGLTTQGQGHQTAFAQIVADSLGVRIEDVHVTSGDTRRFGYAVGTFASRAAVMSGNAVGLAAAKVRQKALRIAADALEVDPSDLEIVDGVVRVAGRAVDVRSRCRPSRCCRTRCGTRSTRRRRPRPSSPAATLRTSRRWRRTTSPAWRGRTTTRRSAPRSPAGCMRRSSRPTPRPRRSGCCGTAWSTTAARWSTR